MRFTDVRTLSRASGAPKNGSAVLSPVWPRPRLAAGALAWRTFLTEREWFGLAPPVAARGSRQLTSSKP